MTEQEIKAEHDRLRPILFDGAPEYVSKAYLDDGEWIWVNYKGDIPWHYYLSHNQPKTTLNWTDTLIERGDA